MSALHDDAGLPSAATKPGKSVPLRALEALASLRLTVVLFSLSMVLVFFGTLAMMDKSIDETMKDYFRSWFVLIELRTITDFGRVFLGFSDDAYLGGKIPFPGGFVIGWLMFLNLMAAHALRFKLTWRRSGIFLLHAGVIVLLAGEFFTAQFAQESRMSIEEGKESNYTFSLTDHEIVLIDDSNTQHDDVYSVPAEAILDLEKDAWFSHPDVPVEIRRVEHFLNSDIRDLQPGEKPVADRGLGLTSAIQGKRKVKGTDSNGTINFPSMYVALRDKQGTELGTYLLSTQFDRGAQRVDVGGKSHRIAYRFKRTYKDYRVRLDSAAHDVYAGTSTPKNYSSTVRITQADGSLFGPVRIWMNHPLLYKGETFYQSSMHTDSKTGVKTTGLQVVVNPAWTFPYFACAMVGVGMSFHFLLKLVGFLQRRRRTTVVTVPSVSVHGDLPRPTPLQLLGKWFPLVIVLLAAIVIVYKAQTPSTREGKKNLYLAGKIPVQHGGRVQPLDSLARNSLMVISGKQEVEHGTGKDKETLSAIDWLLTVWSDKTKADQIRVFRIEHPQLLKLLKLDQRPGSYRYAMAEIAKGGDGFLLQIDAARDKEPDNRTLFEKKVLELSQHLRVYQELSTREIPGVMPAEEADGKWVSYRDAFGRLAPGIMKSTEERMRDEVTEEMHDPAAARAIAERHVGSLRPDELEKVINQVGGMEKFQAEILRREVLERSFTATMSQFNATLGESYPGVASINKVVDTHKGKDAEAFNAAVADHQGKHTSGVSEEDLRKSSLEAWMNHLDPFLQCMVLYIGVAILAALSWLVWHQPLRRGAFWLAVFTLGLHTAALLARMYIGGRPPVTNLYSSAVFIGWGALGLCLFLEHHYKLGIGSFAGAALGFGTLRIARFLAASGSGDTLAMLEAVLDTNFWLSTHVTCVTMGYVATAVAGLIGAVYVIGGVFTPAMRGETGRQVAGMVYGTIAFATVLSFVGTVLGGIWGDQSWGRFWGWDPKENGAVLIVIWNSLILHARWGGLAKARGIAVLAVLGNMVVAWSWFGTNQLGIGLHAYGFDNRLAMGCTICWISLAMIAALGLVPTRLWASFTETAKSPTD